MTSSLPVEPPASSRAFVPVRLAERLQPEGEREVHFDGVVLVVDISGYARLTETCADRGDGGMEGLRDVLTGVFGAALDIIESFGGEIVYFAGDALVCYWGFAGGNLAREARLASACVRDLLADAARRTSSDAASPPIHIGMAAGRLWAARMGGWSGRWDLLFGGRATRAAFAAMRRAGPGELWSTRGTRRALETGEVGGPWDDAPCPMQEVVESLAEETREERQARANGSPRATAAHADWLAPAVEARAERDDGDWTAELRQVQCLFLRIADLDESGGEALARFRKVLFIAHDTLRTASATGRLVIDESGLTLVWVAGEPMGGTETGDSNALFAAVRLTERLRRAGYRPAVGFAMGRAYCGTLGSTRRRETVVIGLPMVLAARLMDRADDGLLVTGVSDRDVPTGIRLEALGPFRPKGISRLVPAFRVEISATFVSRRDPVDAVVGREAELAVLDQGFERLAQRQGGVLLIRGRAGIGKSTLIRALGFRAERRGIPCARGEAIGAERRVPYFAWRPIFRTLFADLSFEQPDRLREQLSARMTQVGKDPARAALVNVIFPAAFAETDQTRKVLGQDRRLATHDLILALLDSALAGPHVIAFEDLHDLDSASAELLGLATRRFGHVLFCVSTRPEPAGDEAARVLPVTARLELPTFGSGEVLRMAASLGLGALEQSTAEEICAKSDGVPLYVLAYLRSLDGPYPSQVESGPAAGAPDPIRGVLMRDFDGLSAGENRALKAASVLGERFSEALLREILKEVIAPTDITAMLTAVARRGIVRPDRDAAGAFQFSHALVHAACYEAIPLGHRRDLHRRSGVALERQLTDDESVADELLIALAHHFGVAADHQRALTFAERAALRVRRHGAYREAMRLLDQCLEAAEHLGAKLPRPDPRLRFRRMKAEAAGAIGDREGRKKEADMALALAGLRGVDGSARQKLVGVARLMARTVSRPGSGSRDRRGPDPTKPHGEIAQVYRQLAIGAYFSGDSLQIVYSTTSALRHAEKAGRSPQLSGALASMGMCLGLSAFAAAGRRHLDAAAQLAVELGSDPALIGADIASALFFVGRGNWERVRFHAERCQAASRRIGDTGNWGNAQALRFWGHHYQGDLAQAQVCADVLWEAAIATGNPQHQSWAARFQALCAVRGGQREAARDKLLTARALFAEAAERRREVRPLYELVPVLGDLGAVLFAMGERDEGEELCQDALRQFAEARRPAGHAVLEGCSSVAEVFFTLAAERGSEADLKNAELAVRVLKKYCRIFPIGRPRLAFRWGQLAALRGSARRARAIWGKGLRAARDLDMRAEVDLLALLAAD